MEKIYILDFYLVDTESDNLGCYAVFTSREKAYNEMLSLLNSNEIIEDIQHELNRTLYFTKEAVYVIEEHILLSTDA